MENIADGRSGEREEEISAYCCMMELASFYPSCQLLSRQLEDDSLYVHRRVEQHRSSPANAAAATAGTANIVGN
ncbi:hypothetical protein PoB_007119100 [Plakobranchus ocellatus]|uniref:Uncharacterized protein n=1 Tax=Plakobranchus ocellatus TaxID=259542 RepID=A0AAV4DLD7_9GAST|nr:hypothetical protein PoB_007119100 [Plakobranchus ocellatus]